MVAFDLAVGVIILVLLANAKSNATINCGEICDVCDCHVFHQYTLQITNGQRDELHKHLLAEGVPNAIYYPVALHAQKAYKDTRYKESDFPVISFRCCFHNNLKGFGHFRQLL